MTVTGRMIYEALYAEQGGRWELVEPKYQAEVWDAAAARLNAMLPQPLAPVPTAVEMARDAVLDAVDDWRPRQGPDEAAALRDAFDAWVRETMKR